MEVSDAVKVLNILKEADHGCENCACVLFGMFMNEFPTYKEHAIVYFNRVFETTYLEEDFD